MPSSVSCGESKSKGHKYSEAVDPGIVSRLAGKLGSAVRKKGVYRCVEAAVLYDYVEQEVEYDHGLRPGLNRSPDETLKKGGNCVDQSVLLASLFQAQGFDCELVRVRSSDGCTHCLCEVVFPDSDKVFEDLRSFYRSKRRGGFTFSVEQYPDSGDYLFLADAEIGRFLGDRGRLRKKGYIRETSDCWEWVGVNQRIEI